MSSRNQPGAVAEELDVHTLNLNSTPAELLILGSENRLVRFSVSDCHPLWVAPVNTGSCPEGAPLTSMFVLSIYAE